MIEDKVLYSAGIIDIAETARRLYGSDEKASAVYGRPVPEHDYRFHITYSGGGTVTFNYDATAADVAAWLKQERLLDTKDN